MNANQVMDRMKVLMREIGDVEGRDDRFFEVYSVTNAGAGVEIESDPVCVKITVELDDAMRVPHSNHMFAPYNALTINHGAGTFQAVIRRSHNDETMGSVALAVWTTEGPVDEELMQKCKSLVKHVFDNN